MTTYLANAFSLSMVEALGAHVALRVEPGCDPSQLPLEGAVSVVGHADTAALFSRILGCPVECNRVTVSLLRGDVIIVGQYSGARLPEGATTLPEGAKIVWHVVTVC